MIVALVDDLMFTSKIRAAAAAVGVSVVFARSREAAMTAVREHHPGAVVIDLDSQRTDPLGFVAAINEDAALKGTPTVGFVSHVRTALIEAAREAGVSEVLARSAFTSRLPEILARGR